MHNIKKFIQVIYTVKTKPLSYFNNKCSNNLSQLKKHALITLYHNKLTLNLRTTFKFKRASLES